MGCYIFIIYADLALERTSSYYNPGGIVTFHYLCFQLEGMTHHCGKQFKPTNFKILNYDTLSLVKGALLSQFENVNIRV